MLSVTLRSARAADSHLLFDWINDRELVKSSAAFRPVSEPEHSTWFNQHFSSGGLDVLFVISLADGTAIGYCQLVNVSAVHQSAELRIRIGVAAHRNQGYGTSALRQLVHFARFDKNLHRLFLTVDERNHSAIRAYEKVGFVKEGVMREAAFFDGSFVNLVLMGLLLKGEPI